MKKDSKTSEKVKWQIERFGLQLSRGLSKPRKKFISQILFGVQAGRDIKLSNIARSLNEEIDLIKTENRLSRKLHGYKGTKPQRFHPDYIRVL